MSIKVLGITEFRARPMKDHLGGLTKATSVYEKTLVLINGRDSKKIFVVLPIDFFIQLLNRSGLSEFVKSYEDIKRDATEAIRRRFSYTGSKKGKGATKVT